MTGDTMVKVRDLSHTYERWGLRTQALSNIALDLGAGEWIALIGPNGSGKSTLMKLLAGHLAIQSGSVHIAGQSWAGTSARRRTRLVYLVHQDPTVGTAPALTVGEHLVLAGSANGEAPQRYRLLERQAQQEYLEEMELDVKPAQLVATLSGGQRQLLALLIASLRPARLVLLDEPVAALDAKKAQVCEHVLRAMQASGKSLLMITHDMTFARRNAHRFIQLEDGHIVPGQHTAEMSKGSLLTHSVMATMQGP